MQFPVVNDFETGQRLSRTGHARYEADELASFLACLFNGPHNGRTRLSEVLCPRVAARDLPNILPFVKNPRGFHNSWGGRVLRGVPPARVDYLRIWGIMPDNGLLDYFSERMRICKPEGRYPIDYLLRRSRPFFSLRGDQNGN